MQSLDVYLPPQRPPAGAGPHARGLPVVVFFHGGGWRIGDKGQPPQGPDKGRFFNGRGFAFVSANYRLSPTVAHPAHVEDAAAALAWVYDNAAAQGFDGSRIFVMGHSAGAHLAALAALDPRRLARHGKPLSILRGVILLDGAGYDVSVQARAVLSRRPRSWFAEMYRDAFGEDPAIWADASPVTHVAAAAAAGGAPSFFILHTERPDGTSQAQALAERLSAARIENRRQLVRGYSHIDINRNIGAPGDRVSALILAQMAAWGA